MITYATGETVYPGDIVQYSLGGIPFEATVTTTADDKARPTDFQWWAPKEPDGLLISWKEPDILAKILWPSNPKAVAPFMEINAADEDLKFISRKTY